jgi:hypothetical protein
MRFKLAGKMQRRCRKIFFIETAQVDRFVEQVESLKGEVN